VLDFQFNPATGELSVFCSGVNGGHDSFQWVANDGQLMTGTGGSSVQRFYGKRL
jgi:hypothetical protein